jgi:hypothetical protein
MTQGGPNVTIPASEPRWFRRGALSALALVTLGSLALVLSSCTSDGHLTVFGYSTQPNYDLRYHTVRVPIFKNRTYWTVTPVPGMEMDLTRAVVREIEARTPYKVVQCDADTELVGTIINFTKGILNVLQFNYPREVETTMTVELFWRDLRTGEAISRPARRPGEPIPPELPQPLLAVQDGLPGTKPLPLISPPTLPPGASAAVPVGPDPVVPPGLPKPPPKPVLIRSVAHFRPEVGESITTAVQKNINRMAIRITEVMEKSW